jgi:phospholipase C
MVGTAAEPPSGAPFNATVKQLLCPVAHPMHARRRSAVTSKITFALALLCVLSSAMFLSGCQGVGTAAPTYQLTVTAPPTGSGTITSSPPGINCPTTCSASFNQNTQVTLTASPAANFIFAGWTGACSGTTACAVTLSANATVGANFTAQFSLTVTVSGSGTVTSTPAGINCSSGTCSAAFAQNTQVTLDESASSGADFTGWSGACSGTSNCVVTVSGATSVTASFVAGIPLTVTLAGTGTGTVTSSPPGINCTTGTCTGSFAPNTQVTLTPTPSGTNIFNGWSGACTGTGNCVLTLTASATATATFNPGGTILSINHIIFFAQENRSFDEYFGYLRQYWANNGIADQSFDGLPQFNPTSGAPPLQGPVPTNPPCGSSDPDDYCNANPSAPASQWVPSFHIQSVCTEDTSPFWNEAHVAWNFNFNYPSTTTWMDNGFVQQAANELRGTPPTGHDTNGYRSMGYFTDADLNYYYYMATQFGTSDRWFAPVMTRTQPNRSFIWAATSQGHVYPQNPKVPADSQPYSAETIAEALQNAGITWKVYMDTTGLVMQSGGQAGTPCTSFTGIEFNECLAQNSYINEFTYESTIQSTPTLAQNFQPITQFATDVANQTLPQVALIEPPSDAALDEHPSDNDGYTVDIQAGANWVEYNVINTLMWSNPNAPGGTPSASWHDSALIFTYDEWGGFFDHVQPQPVPVPNSPAGDSPYPVDLQPPPNPDICYGADQSSGPCSFAVTGYRIPLIVVSPYAKKNFVSHVVRDTTAWLNFVEERFNVPALNARDAYWSQPGTGGTGVGAPATAAMDEFFDYSNPPWMTPPTPPGQNTGGNCSLAAPNPF